MDTERTLRELSELPRELSITLRAYAQYEEDMCDAKASLAQHQQELDDVLAFLALDAHAEGIIDGKNQAMRDVQLKAYLAGAADAQSPREEARDSEELLAKERVALGIMYTQGKALSCKLRAAMATAELQSAILNAGTMKEDKDQ